MIIATARRDEAAAWVADVSTVDALSELALLNIEALYEIAEIDNKEPGALCKYFATFFVGFLTFAIEEGDKQ